MDQDTTYTNLILQKVLGDACFSWADARHHRNSFGHTQHRHGHRCTFQRILTNAGPFEGFNKLKSLPMDNAAFTNLWVVIDNPQNVQLRDLVDTIEFESGGHRYQRYCTSDIELEINVLAHMFKVDGVAYHPGKIHVPIVVPYNAFIFNNTHHDARIRVLKHTNHVCGVDVYANVCDARVFPELSHTTNMTHKCSFVFYRTQHTGTQTISTTKSLVRLHFSHPTYALYIMNVSKEQVTSIKLFLDNYTNSFELRSSELGGFPPQAELASVNTPNTRTIATYEYPLNDIEWHDHHAIVWFNRQFLTLESLNTHVNISCCHSPYVTMENTYSDLNPNPMNIIAVSFDMMRIGDGMTGLRYVG